MKVEKVHLVGGDLDHTVLPTTSHDVENAITSVAGRPTLFQNGAHVGIPNGVSVGPGPSNLLYGDSSLGYFGTAGLDVMPSSSETRVRAGMSLGPMREIDYWFKFYHKGKVLFFPNSSIRYDVSWNDISVKRLVYGKTVRIGDHTFNVRLIDGAQDVDSEWNALIYRLWDWDTSGSTANKPADMWDSLTSAELGFSGYGWVTHCQNTVGSESVYRPTNSAALMASGDRESSFSNSNFGWRPVLELIQ